LFNTIIQALSTTNFIRLILFIAAVGVMARMLATWLRIIKTDNKRNIVKQKDN